MTPTELYQIRALTGLTQSEFAEKLGYSRTAITMKENGTSGIKPPFIKLVQKTYKKPFTFVMNDVKV